MGALNGRWDDGGLVPDQDQDPDSRYAVMDDEGPQDPTSPDQADEQDNAPPQPNVGAGALSAADRAAMQHEAEGLRHDVDTEYGSAMDEKKRQANAIRDALRSSRDRLVNEHPDRQALWMSVAAAMGAPTRGFGIGASMSQAAGAAVPFLAQEARDKLARNDAVSRYDEALAGYGDDPQAMSGDLTNMRLKLADMKARMAGNLTSASMRGATGRGAAQTQLGKLLEERNALAPGDPNRALYDKQIALLQKSGTGGDAAMMVGDMTKTGEDYLATIPADMRATVKALSEGRQALPSGFAQRQPRWQKIMAALGQYDPSFDFVNSGARAQARKSFSAGGKDADNLTKIGTAIHHLNSLSDAYAKLGNNQFEWSNMVGNYVRSHAGDTKIQGAVAGVSANAIAVAHELAAVFRQTGMSESEIKDWQNQITTSATPAASKAIIDKALELMDGRLYELGEKYNRSMGTTKDPMQLLAPEDQAIYRKLKGEAPPEAVAVPGMGRGHGATGSFAMPANTPAGAADVATRSQSYLPPLGGT